MRPNLSLRWLSQPVVAALRILSVVLTAGGGQSHQSKHSGDTERQRTCLYSSCACMYSGIRGTLVKYIDRRVSKLNVNNTTRVRGGWKMQRRRQGDAWRKVRRVVEGSTSYFGVDFYTGSKSHATLWSPFELMHLDCSKSLRIRKKHI